MLGLWVAMGSRSRLAATAGLVALFAIFHGYAHGTEMHAGLAPFAYAAGFVIATATLHAIGIVSGLLMKRADRPAIARLVGGAIALCGAALFCV
jgi:urease accessory protein